MRHRRVRTTRARVTLVGGVVLAVLLTTRLLDLSTPPPPPSTTHTHTTPPLAVCVFGQLRETDASFLTFREYVLGHLSGTLFVSVASPIDSASQFVVNAVATNVVDDVVVLREANASVYPRRLIAKHAHLGRGGDWLGPLNGNRGSALFQIYHKSACGSMIRAFERRHLVRFEQVMFTRSDFYWLTAHPALNTSRCAWIPTGEDNHGVNDRHLLVRRADADVLFDEWTTIIDGTFECTRSNVPHPLYNEFMLECLLRTHAISICRFPSIAFLTCDASVRATYTARSRCGIDKYSGVWRKYDAEMRTAFNHAHEVKNTFLSRHAQELAEWHRRDE